MPQELPIACTLDDAQLGDQLAAWGELGADALAGVELCEGNATLCFRGARDRIALLVEAESRCCAFFDFVLETDADATRLEIRAPAGAEDVLREFVGAIAGDRLAAWPSAGATPAPRARR